MQLAYYVQHSVQSKQGYSINEVKNKLCTEIVQILPLEARNNLNSQNHQAGIKSYQSFSM